MRVPRKKENKSSQARGSKSKEKKGVRLRTTERKKGGRDL